MWGEVEDEGWVRQRGEWGREHGCGAGGGDGRRRWMQAETCISFGVHKWRGRSGSWSPWRQRSFSSARPGRPSAPRAGRAPGLGLAGRASHPRRRCRGKEEMERDWQGGKREQRVRRIDLKSVSTEGGEGCPGEGMTGGATEDEA